MPERLKHFTIRNMPESLHRALKVRAAQEGKSLQDLIIEILQAGVKKSKN